MKGKSIPDYVNSIKALLFQAKMSNCCPIVITTEEMQSETQPNSETTSSSPSSSSCGVVDQLTDGQCRDFHKRVDLTHRVHVVVRSGH